MVEVSTFRAVRGDFLSHSTTVANNKVNGCEYVQILHNLTRLLQKRNLSFCHINPISKETSISSCNSNFHKTSCGALLVNVCAFWITKVGVCRKELQSIVHFVFANWQRRCWVKMEKWSRTDRQRQGKILDINIEQNCFIYVGSHIMDGKCLHSILSRI